MVYEEATVPWNLKEVTDKLKTAFENNSEAELLAILKNNSFLLHDLYSRKYGIQPAFHEISFGGELRCDFAWLNDNSDGPEWVLVEVEKPRMSLFNGKKEPTSELNHAIEQVKGWRRYFNENPLEKKRIFGAVGRFRFILVVGDKEVWSQEFAQKWRIDNNKESDIEIRSSDVFIRPLKILEDHPDELWSFAEHPTTRNHAQLKDYWENYGYMDLWRRFL